MARSLLKPKPAVDDDEYEDEYMTDEEEAETQKQWDDFMPEFYAAIEDGWMDAVLADIAIACRERYMELYPQFAATQPRLTGKKIPGSKKADPSQLPVLGIDGNVVPVAEWGVGLTGRIPTGCFRANNNAYSKDDFVGRQFRVRRDITFPSNRRRISTTIEAGSIMQIVNVGQKRFDARLVTYPNGVDVPQDLRKLVSLILEFNMYYLLEGGDSK